MKIKYSDKLSYIGFATLSFSLFLLLFQFNNCGKVSSKNTEQTSVSTSGANVPVDSSNPYILRCITSSDGVKVAAALRRSIVISTAGANKINSIDWDQQDDLLVTLDNECALFLQRHPGRYNNCLSNHDIECREWFVQP